MWWGWLTIVWHSLSYYIVLFGIQCDLIPFTHFPENGLAFELLSFSAFVSMINNKHGNDVLTPFQHQCDDYSSIFFLVRSFEKPIKLDAICKHDNHYYHYLKYRHHHHRYNQVLFKTLNES